MVDQGKVVILDATLRDSGYAIHFQFSARDTRNLCLGLEKAGVEMIEVGHGLGLGASSLKHGVALETDADYVQAAASALTRAKFGAFFIPGIGNRDDMSRAAALGMHFVRVGYDVTDIDVARPFVDYAKELGLNVSLNPMKSYAVSVSDFGVIAARAESWQSVDTLCVVDSAGCMLPDQVAAYTRAARESCGLSLGFHGHNNLGLANANCLAAVAEGARYVDGTLRGMGRSAGNAQTEILAYILQKAGYQTNVDPVTLFNVLTTYLEPLMLQPQGIPPLEALYGMTQFHSSHLPRFRRVLAKYDVDIKRLIMAVSEVDCINPPDALIESVARDLSRTDE
jgi:4-hydroxy 2-oxovalerate aldolase